MHGLSGEGTGSGLGGFTSKQSAGGRQPACPRETAPLEALPRASPRVLPAKRPLSVIHRLLGRQQAHWRVTPARNEQMRGVEGTPDQAATDVEGTLGKALALRRPVVVSSEQVTPH